MSAKLKITEEILKRNQEEKQIDYHHQCLILIAFSVNQTAWKAGHPEKENVSNQEYCQEHSG